MLLRFWVSLSWQLATVFFLLVLQGVGQARAGPNGAAPGPGRSRSSCVTLAAVAVAIERRTVPPPRTPVGDGPSALSEPDPLRQPIPGSRIRRRPLQEKPFVAMETVALARINEMAETGRRQPAIWVLRAHGHEQEARRLEAQLEEALNQAAQGGALPVTFRGRLVPSRDSNSPQAQAEVAVYRFDQLIGQDSVPAAVMSRLRRAPGLWRTDIDEVVPVGPVGLVPDEIPVFDWITGNTDLLRDGVGLLRVEGPRGTETHGILPTNGRSMGTGSGDGNLVRVTLVRWLRTRGEWGSANIGEYRNFFSEFLCKHPAEDWVRLFDSEAARFYPNVKPETVAWLAKKHRDEFVRLAANPPRNWAALLRLDDNVLLTEFPGLLSPDRLDALRARLARFQAMSHR